MRNADVKVRIPMLGKVNSLNVSIAAALITYEAVRQRNEKQKKENL
jgi:tRNA G18 (ribose-2'-O)-methylase SpoU